MWYFRVLVILGLIGMVILWRGAAAQQAAPTAQPAVAAPPTAARPDPEATKLLDKAIEVLDPRRLGWVETELWQQVDVQGASFQAQGRYLSGPDYRYRLDFKVRLGETDGDLQVVSDGATIWQAQRIGTFDRAIVKIDLKKVLETVRAPGMRPEISEQLQNEFFQSQSLAGIAPLLRAIREQVTFTKQETGRWNGREMNILIGAWSGDVAKLIAPVDRWPAALPRSCRLYLDKQTLWPARLEWWGPLPPRPEDALLLQMEFRDPVIRPADAKPPARFATAFTFDAAGAPVSDQTKEVSEGLKARAQQLAAQRGGGTPRPPDSTPKK